MKDFKKTPGARESSAGDDFHLLWAGRKALNLLMPNTSLKALAIEGPDRNEEELLDPSGDQLLAIDLAEYYDGDCFATAKCIVLSQLKYSTRNPRREWTVARLCEGKDTTGRGSVIRRLAETFQRYYSIYGREAIVQKLQLKLVSNQPAGKNLKNVLNVAQGFLQGRANKTSKKTLLDNMLSEDLVAIEQLFSGARLGSYEFTDFLRVLDISDLGGKSRFGQKIELVKELGSFSKDDIYSQYRELKELIWDRMMPEAWKRGPLTKYDIVPVFGTTYSSIYPAQPKFELPAQVLRRKEVSDFACTVVGSAGKPICLHSTGGKGKTILAQKLEEELPLNSVVIVFDCYGGGTYLNPADTRHSINRSIPQIANEIASRTGGPLLLQFKLSSEDLLREFMKRVEISVSLVKKENPDALVVIVIDAADNSVHAAMEKSEKSFVHDLLKLTFPHGSRLVVTCRTENKDILNLGKHEPLEMGGFDDLESAMHLRLYFQEATEQQADEFHRLTKGIPRVQGYALSFREKGLDELLSPMRPNGKTLEEMFDSWLEEAKKRHGVPEDINRICEALIGLPRPIPVVYIVALTGVPAGTVESFSVDMGFGLVENDDAVSFRDQDFEDYLRQHISDVEELTVRIADLLYKDRCLSRYAAYHLDTFLARTGRFKDLSKLVLEEDIENSMTDPVEQQEIKLNRIRSAIRIGAKQKERTQIIKLLLVAAATVKTDTVVRKLIVDNADLAEKFGNAQTVQRLHLDVSKQKWPVPSLFRSAAVLSRFEATKARAQENLKEAHGWLRWRSSVPEDKRYSYSLEDKDIAAGAEAILRLQGVKAAKVWLSRWRPPHTVYESTYLLAASVLRVDGEKEFERHLSEVIVRTDIALAVLRAYREANITPSISFMEKAIKTWYRFGRSGRRPSEEIQLDGIAICEASAREELLRPFLPELLVLFTPALLNYAPHLYGNNIKHVDALLRSQILQAKSSGMKVNLELFLPEKLKCEKLKIPYSEREELDREHREFKQLFGSLLPIYELRVDVLLGIVTKDTFQARFKECLQNIERDYEIQRRHDAGTIYQLMIVALADAALMISEIPFNWIKEIDRIIMQNKVGRIITLRLSLAEKAVSLPKYHNGALRLLDEVRQDLERAPGIASDQIDTWIKCTRIAELIDPKVALDYFHRAVGAASEIDEEAYAQISCMSSIAGKAAADPMYTNPELAYLFARFTEDCHRRMDGWDHFPWNDIIKGLSSLDMASAFAMLGRWDDRRVLTLQDEILTVLKLGVQRGFISSELAWALSMLAYPYDRRFEEFTTVILDRASGDSVRTKRLLSIIEKDIQLHTPIDERFTGASKVVDWAQKHHFIHFTEVESLKKLVGFLKQNKKNVEFHGPTWKDSEIRKMPDWSSLLGGRSFLTSDEIELAIDEFKDFDRYRHATLKEFLEKIRKSCVPKDYITQLNALITVDLKKLPVEVLLDALNNCVEEWNVHPGVRQWRQTKCSDFLERYIGEMFGYGGFKSFLLKRFKEVFDVQDKDVFELIINAVSEWIDVSAEATYQLVQELLPSLVPVEAENVLQWMLGRATVRFKDNWADGPWQEGLCPPKGANETLGLFLWGILGHPDKRLRWRAVHVVRRMIQLGHSEIVEELVSHMNDKDSPIFRDTNFSFFWLSARLWVFILLDRLAREAPQVIYSHFHRIMQEAIEPEIPHVLIRHFAQATAFALLEYYPELISDEERVKLESINKSPFSQVKIAPSRNPDERRKGSKDLRFKFDSMDTLPYWYEPLGRVFGKNANEVAVIAEKWICDRWGVFNNKFYADKDPILNRYDFRLWSNDHGGDPVIETRKSYAEWHGMFCAADDILKSTPVVQDDWENNPFENWLARWIFAWPNLWLADLRDPVPLEDIYWHLERPESKDWENEIHQDAFDPLIGLPESSLPGYIVLNGYYRRANKGVSESMFINSALVTPEKASALLRAVQTVENPRDYCIPLEGERLEINEDGFELQGWLRTMGSEWGNIDELDPLRNSISSSITVPSQDFIEWGDLISSCDHKYHWRRENEEEKVSILECWNDLQEREREYKEFHTEGQRLWVRVETLLEYLKNRRRFLIVKCMIDRWVDKKGMGEYVPGKAKIYLIKPDGTVETLGEHYHLG